jgi:hypothetical protein
MTDDEVIEAFGDAVAEVTVSYEVVVDWLQCRVDACGRDENARRLVVKHWPQGVAYPRKGLVIEDIDRLVRFLDRVEAEAGLQFGESDPRYIRGGHKSDRRLLPVAPPTNTGGS